MSVNKIQNDVKNKDKEDKENKEDNQNNIGILISNKCKTDQALYGVFHIIMTFIAVYLSFKCNKDKFNPTTFIFALLFPYIYIIYVLGTRGTCDK